MIRSALNGVENARLMVIELRFESGAILVMSIECCGKRVQRVRITTLIVQLSIKYHHLLVMPLDKFLLEHPLLVLFEEFLSLLLQSLIMQLIFNRTDLLWVTM